jgi:chemotaxis protein CheX
MRNEFVEPFVSSAVSVFSTMLGCKVEAGSASGQSLRDPSFDVAGIIGLSGKSSGVVMVHMSRDLAISASEAMLGSKPPEVNSDVIDAVGELTNMIAGAAKAKLSPIFDSVALPLVLVGQNSAISLPSRSSLTCIPFQSPWGKLTIEIDVSDKAKA